MTEEEIKKACVDTVMKLDSISSRAFLIWAEALTSGETSGEASKKAADFLSKNPGYEKQAKIYLKNTDELEREHK